MAGDSLGTMTVGVTANVSDAERALNGLANMLERFDRQQQSRSRSGGGKGGAGGGGYFSPMSEEFQNEIKRMEQVQKRTEAALRFREIRRSEEMGANTRQLDENMRGLSEAFKVGGAAGAEEYLNRTNRAIAQVGDTSARTRYAVLNLGYGIQDAVQVFGTSGLAGAVRASANNLQGLGVLFDKTAGGMKGLTAALMSGEFVVMGIATAVLLAASAWESYAKSVQEAIDKEAADRFKRMDPGADIERAGKEEALNRELARMKKITEAEEKRKQILDDIAVVNAKLNKAGQEEADLRAKINKLVIEINQYQDMRQRLRNLQIPPVAQADIEMERAMRERGGVDAAFAQVQELQKKLDELIGKQGEVGETEKLVREKKQLQEDMLKVEQKIKDMQPDALQKAADELKLLEKKLATAEKYANLHNVENANRDKEIKKIRDAVELADTADKKRAAGLAWLDEREGRGGRATNILGYDPRVPKRFEPTAAEKAAVKFLNDLAVEGKTPEEAIADLKKRAQPIPIAQEWVDFGKKEIADLMERFPQLKKDRTLEEQESDMEYRLQFLRKKRADAQKDLRAIEKGSPAASFESAQAYEALARSRMNVSPEQDRLNKILAAEERSAKALEDIREKLDPGRRERLVILESFE